jgi:hypothetical protein
VEKVDLPPRPPGRLRVTPGEAMEAAAAAGIRLRLRQPDPHSAWLADEAGRPVFWAVLRGCIYFRTFRGQSH